MSDLDNLKKSYNAALERFLNMEKWCETASIEEQLKYEDEIYFVIDEVTRLYNILRKKGEITSSKVLRGFKE
ncbi:MAG TPA: hypothetical protein GX723_09825 [Thermoanaerobacterales bacterium]|nr:hypothetical protein [Thermoanaerobacterales bacterium]